MPTINLEMMKQLLQEFSEKEALTTEEIKLIEQEITTLEKRVNFCREKLQNLGADKEKLLTMKERYVNGNFPSAPRVPFVGGTSEPTSHFSPSVSTKEATATMQQSPTNPSAAAAAQAQLDNIDTLEPATVSQQAEVVESSHPNSNYLGDHRQSPHSPESSPELVSADNKEDADNKEVPEGGEHIKSINDALKGLFRSPGQNKK